VALEWRKFLSFRRELLVWTVHFSVASLGSWRWAITFPYSCRVDGNFLSFLRYLCTWCWQNLL